VYAHPEKPVRLYTSSIYVFDPSSRTANLGDILGPYVSEARLLYRHALDSPLLETDGQPRIAGPYLNPENHSFWVLDADSNRIFESPKSEPVGGFELSPDGRYVAVVASASSPLLYLIDLQSGERRNLGSGRWPAWSDDGNHLSCLTEIQTKRIIRVHHLEAREFTPVDLPLPIRPESPSLNEDGTRVLFVDRGSIYVIDVP
jgi:WD40 repeat protein